MEIIEIIFIALVSGGVGLVIGYFGTNYFLMLERIRELEAKLAEKEEQK